MKRIIMAIVAISCIFGYAETVYQLKSDVYAYMLDDSGNCPICDYGEEDY